VALLPPRRDPALRPAPAASQGARRLTGEETFDLAPLEEGATTLRVSTSSGVAFDARVRIDTPNEWRYFRHGGILHFVLRQLRSQS
jgi:aconitate hydratase